MTTFWMIAGLLMLMAVALTLYPLFAGGGRQWSLARHWPVGLVAIFVPVAGLLLYFKLGNPASLAPAPPVVEAQNNPSQSHELSADQIEAMTQRLQERLKSQPDNAEGWAVLARSFGVLKRYQDSSDAYARALQLQPDNAQLMVDYADTLAMVNGRSLEGEPENLVRKALQLEPNNLKALAMAGTIAYNRQDYPCAIVHWQRIIDLVPADSPIAGPIMANLVEVRKLAGRDSPAPGAATAEKNTTPIAAGMARVSGMVSIAPALKSQAREADTVYIFARADGDRSGPPLAILRKTVKDLPLAFTLDDTMAMSPAFKLSSASKVVIGARISKTGDAMPAAGDMEGYSGLSDVGATGVAVTIDVVLK